MKQAVIWALKISLLFALVAVVFFVHQIAGTLVQDVQLLRVKLEQGPQDAAHVASLEEELQRRSLDVTRIEQYLISRDEIVDVVSTIEQQAAGAGVAAEVSDIEVVLDPETGKPPEGPLQDVRMNLVATGSSENLLQFLYRVDHLPYLIYVSSWNLGQRRGAGVQAPINAPLPDSGTSGPAADENLSADVIIVINAEDE